MNKSDKNIKSFLSISIPDVTLTFWIAVLCLALLFVLHSEQRILNVIIKMSDVDTNTVKVLGQTTEDISELSNVISGSEALRDKRTELRELNKDINHLQIESIILSRELKKSVDLYNDELQAVRLQYNVILVIIALSIISVVVLVFKKHR